MTTISNTDENASHPCRRSRFARLMRAGWVWSTAQARIAVLAGWLARPAAREFRESHFHWLPALDQMGWQWFWAIAVLSLVWSWRARRRERGDNPPEHNPTRR